MFNRKANVDVIFLAYRDSVLSGGSIRVLEALCKQYSSLDINFRIFFVYGSNGILGSKFHGNCIYLEAISGRGFLAIFKYIEQIFKFKPKIIHFIDPVYWAQLLMIIMPFKGIAHIHGGFWRDPNGWRTRFLWLISRLGIRNFIAITHGARDEMIANGFAASSKISVVYNSSSIEERYSDQDRYRIRGQLGISNENILIGSVGRLVGGRGFDDLIRTMQYLDGRWHALVVGDGPVMGNLRDLAKSLNLEGRIHLVGNKENVNPYYQAMDVYGFFARYESFGIALADAMVMKKPIFGLIGAGEYCDPRCPLITSQNSTMIPRPDSLNQWRAETEKTLIQLAVELKKYENDPNKFDCKRDNAYNLVNEKFSATRQCNETIEAYRKCNVHFKLV